MKILIIGTRYTSIPSICGRAIEGLVDEYLKYNSKAKKCEITVYSAFNRDIKNSTLDQYDNVDFRFINLQNLKYKFRRLICGMGRKFLKNKIGDEFVRTVKEDLKHRDELNKYDKIVILNSINNITYVCKKIKGKHILYLHNDYLNIETKNAKEIVDSLDEIWCVSKFIKKRVDAIAEENKTVVIYNGTDLTEFNSEVEFIKIKNFREKYNIQDNNYIILYNGRIIKEKGIAELISAYKLFSENKKNVKLLITGGPTDLSVEFYNNLVNKNKNNSSIVFLNRVTRDELKVIYKIVNVQVVPSILNEAFGLTVVEGMSAGIPMIVSNSGGIPEIVGDDCAIIVERKDIVNQIVEALNKIYENKGKISETMTENSKKRVQEFSMDKFFNNLECKMLE